MKIFVCSKCNSKDVFISKSGNNTGLYCGDCGKWITWLNKDELRLAERQINGNIFLQTLLELDNPNGKMSQQDTAQYLIQFLKSAGLINS